MKSVKKVQHQRVVCDVTVARNHNLFVKAKISDCAVLAHNCLDENLKGLDAFLGEYYYSLGNLSVQYGFTGYLNAEFGKQHRANFGEADLNDKPVVRYCLSGDNYVSTECGPKPIAEVQVGDLVYSFNHETAAVELQAVTMISHHETEESMFEIDYGDGVIRLTESHEVWSVTRQSYVKVRDLAEDEDILLEEFENLTS